MQRLFEKRDNQPVSMIYDNPTSESFTKFREKIRRSSHKQMQKFRNSKKSGYANTYKTASMMNRPMSLIGASTMGSPVKTSPSNINKLNTYSDNIPSNPKLKNVDLTLQRVKPIILPIDKMTMNKVVLGLTRFSDKDTTKKSIQNSRKGSEKSIPVDTAEHITRMALSINIAKRKLIFEFDVDRTEDGMMVEEES